MEQEINKKNNNTNLEVLLESVLFWKGEPVSIKKLSQIFTREESDILTALKKLEVDLSERGIVLMFKEDEVTLATSKDASELIEKLTKEELVRDLGKAGLETLSIIIYQGPLSRAEIDYIRGVQSNFILRNLMIRGLVEKVPNPKDQRSFLYKPTFEMLSFMGISKIEDMPSYNEARAEIESYKNSQLEKNTQENDLENTTETESTTEQNPQETEEINSQTEDTNTTGNVF